MHLRSRVFPGLLRMSWKPRSRSPGWVFPRDQLTESSDRRLAAALRAFQTSRYMPGTGELDAATKQALQLDRPPLANYVITSNDLARLQPLSTTWLGKSQQSALEFETPLELAAENCCASPRLMLRLNPSRELDEHLGRHSVYGAGRNQPGPCGEGLLAGHQPWPIVR